MSNYGIVEMKRERNHVRPVAKATEFGLGVLRLARDAGLSIDAQYAVADAAVHAWVMA